MWQWSGEEIAKEANSGYSFSLYIVLIKVNVYYMNVTYFDQCQMSSIQMFELVSWFGSFIWLLDFLKSNDNESNHALRWKNVNS